MKINDQLPFISRSIIRTENVSQYINLLIIKQNYVDDDVTIIIIIIIIITFRKTNPYTNLYSCLEIVFVNRLVTDQMSVFHMDLKKWMTEPVYS